jgi:hypothetical protein
MEGKVSEKEDWRVGRRRKEGRVGFLNFEHQEEEEGKAKEWKRGRRILRV